MLIIGAWGPLWRCAGVRRPVRRVAIRGVSLAKCSFGSDIASIPTVLKLFLPVSTF